MKYEIVMVKLLYFALLQSSDYEFFPLCHAVFDTNLHTMGAMLHWRFAGDKQWGTKTLLCGLVFLREKNIGAFSEAKTSWI